MVSLDNDVIAGWISALEAASQMLSSEPHAAADSVHRVASAIRRWPQVATLPQLSQAAQAVEAAPRADLGSAALVLMDQLRSTSRQAAAQDVHLLIIDGDPVIHRLMKMALSSPGRFIHCAASAAEARQVLRQTQVSLVVLDLVLPDTDGRNLLIELRQDPATAAIPLFVLASNQGSMTQAECYALGAEGFFEKPFDTKVLASSVSAAIHRASLNQRQVRHDLLTGLPNQAAFLDEFHRYAALADRAHRPLTVALIDLDHLGAINQQYGKSVGDQVLQGVAHSIRQSFRASDVAARWSGPQLAAALPHTDREGAQRALKKALEAVHNLRFSSGEQTFCVTFSAGVAQVQTQESPDQALARAQRLLASAKAAGRNRIVSSDGQSAPPAAHLLLLEPDPDVRRLVVDRLSGEGMHVHLCPDSAAAVQLAKDHDLTLCLLDMQSSGSVGLELLSALRQTARTRRIPVIMLTALGDEENLSQAFELGADDYLVKPFSTIELSARVHRLIRL